MHSSRHASPRFRSFTLGRATTAWIVAAVAATSASCSSSTPEELNSVEISAVEAAITAQENTTRALRGIASTGDFLAESATLAEMLSSLSGSSEECEPTDVGICEPTGSCPSTPEPTCEDTPSVTVEDLQEMRDDINQGIDELEAKLRDEVFIDANLESDDGTYATYRVPASLICDSYASVTVDSPEPNSGTTDAAPAPSEPTPQLDPECVDQVARFAPKLRLSSPGGQNVNVDLLLGPDASNVATFQLYTDRIGVSLDLGKTLQVAKDMGEDTENIVELDGKVQFELVRNEERDYSLRYNILEDVKLVSSSDDELVTVEEAAQSPIFELRLDGRDAANGSVTGSYNLGAVRVSGPLNAFRDLFDGDDEVTYDSDGNELPSKVYTGTIEAFLAGLEGSLKYSGDADTLKFTGIGLGDVTSFLKHNDQTLFSLDLNKDDGRHFDLTFQTTGEHPLLTFSPTFDLTFVSKLQLLAAQIEDIPSELLDNVYHLWFEGEDPQVQVEDNQLRVVTGTMHLESSSDPDANLSVEAGMCLIGPETDDDSAPVVGGDAAAPVPSEPPVDDTTEPSTPVDEPVEEESSSPFASLTSGACL